MSKENVSSSLTELIERFSQDDVILQIEREYQNVAAINVPLELIDDNSFVNKVVFTKKIVNLLGKSLAEKGFFNPLVVREKDNRYELILGRKRYFGAQKAGFTEVPVIIKNIGDEETLLMLLADTRDEREGSKVEMAYIYNALIKKFNYSQSMLGNISHQSRSQVTNTIRLLSLPDKVLKEVVMGTLSYGHARALLSLDPADILNAVQTIHDMKLSVRETELMVRRYHHTDEEQEKEISLRSKSKARDVKVKPTSITFEFEGAEEKEAFIKRYLSD